MKTYAVMKEDGAGDVLPGAFHPLCNPSNILPDPVALNSPFISGLLRSEAGSDAGTVYAKGGLAFICPQGSDERYVVNGTQGIQSLLLYDAWAETHLTDPDLVTLFEKAWSLYPEGFYWVPAIHPYCVLRSKEEPLKLIHAPVDSSSSSTPALRLCLCVQRYASAASFGRIFTTGLTVSGSFEPTSSLCSIRRAYDILWSPAARAFSSDSSGGLITSTGSNWNDTPTVAVNGTDYLPLLSNSSGLLVTNASAINNTASLFLSWPDTITSAKMAKIVSSDVNDPAAFFKTRGLSESRISAIVPTMRLGAYTKQGTLGSSTMIVSGVSLTTAEASGLEDAGLSGENLGETDEYYAFCCVAHPDAVNASDALAGSVGTATVDSNTATALLGSLGFGSLVALRRAYGFYEDARVRTLTLNLTLSTGLTEYYIEKVQVRARIDYNFWNPAKTLPAGVSIASYDSTTCLLVLEIDTEAAGLATEGSGESKHFVQGQSVDLSIDFTAGGSPGTDSFKAMLSIGGFKGGGDYSDAGEYGDAPDFLTEWDTFEPTVSD